VLRPAAPSFHDRQIPAAAPTGSARLAFLISASNLALYRVGGGVSLRQPAMTCWRRPHRVTVAMALPHRWARTRTLRDAAGL
jgi:hypothetical protein